MGARTNTHKIEDISKSYICSLINETEIALYREITGRDYGIDAIVELFNKDMPTGKIAFIQIKATSNAIVPLKNSPQYVSCPNVSVSNISYTFQKNIPVILIYVYLKGERGFYYKILNNRIPQLNIYNKQKTITIRLPIENHITKKADLLLKEIETYYSNKN